MTLWGENNTMREKITPWGKKRTPWTEKRNTMVKKPATHRPPDHLTFSGHPIEVSTRYATPSVDTGHTASHAPGHPLAAQPPGIWRTTLATRWGRKNTIGRYESTRYATASDETQHPMFHPPRVRQPFRAQRPPAGEEQTPLGKEKTPLGKEKTPLGKKKHQWGKN